MKGIEAAARAICARTCDFMRDGGDPPRCCGTCTFWDIYAQDAQAAISAYLAAEGAVMVPRIVTPLMEDAHFEAHAKSETIFASVQEVWDAMLAAAPKEG